MVTINLSDQEQIDLRRMYHVIKNMYLTSVPVNNQMVTDQKIMIATLAAVKVLSGQDLSAPILVGQEEECRQRFRAIEL